MILEVGKHVVMVVALSGTQPRMLKGNMQDLVSKIEGMYAGIIEKWDGSKEAIQDMNPMLVPLFGIKEGMKIRKEKEEIKVSSGIEFFGGYVRLKVGIKNELATEITEVMMNLTFDDRTLRLSHIEPDYPMKGKTVLMDPIAAGEKRTVAFYLDPLICQESNVDAVVGFKDPYGHQGKAHMKRRPVDIVCPIFHTAENINVAMLKRLLGEVKYSDSRIFMVPEKVEIRKAIDAAKEAVQRHDIKLVRELNQDKPQVIEAWYYGTTSETKEELILKVSIREESRTLEAFVACSNLASMTGLLAEMSNGITSNFAVRGYGELKASTDQSLKDRITVGGRLVDNASG
jgi:hypothetical protein